MTNSIFSYLNKAVVIVLVLLLVISFAISGIGSSISSIGNKNIAATVGNLDISNVEYGKAVRYELQRIGGALGIEINENTKKTIQQMTLNKLIREKMLRQETERLGIIVSDKHVIDVVRQDPSFQVAGKFNKEQYNRMVRSVGQTDKSYSNFIKRDLARQMLLDAMVEGPIISDELAKILHEYDGEKRNVKTLSIPANYIKNVAEPTDDELKKYFEEQKGNFSAPEYRTISYLSIGKDDVVDDIDLSQQRLEQFYEENIDQYFLNETRDLEQVFVTEESVINDIHAGLEKGGDFYKLSLEKASRDKKSVQYGDSDKEDLSVIFQAEDVETLFTLEKNEYTKPMKSLIGWHIFRVLGSKEAHTQKFTEVQDKVKQNILQKEAGDILYQLSGNIEDELAGGASFEELKDKLGFKLDKINEVSIEGKTMSGDIDSSIPKYVEFLPTAFDIGEGEVSQLVASEDGFGYYAVRVDGIVSSRLRLLEEVRGKVIDRWKSDKKTELQYQTAKEIADSLGEAPFLLRLKMLEDKAKSLGLKIKEVKSVYRESLEESILPRSLIDDLYQIKEVGASSKNYADSDGSQIVGVVSQIIKASADDEQFSTDKIKESLMVDIQQDLEIQFISGLTRRYPVKYK